ncbi:MAG: response regulator [Synergistaceae bacterium]|jgi:response regulator of citrate/malate metabolism|nr:response regulator [Synergistaceae bacterium]
MKEEKCIIIVDDDPDICFTISEICCNQGWNPISCTNHLELARRLETEKPNLFLVDYHLPEMDGVGIVRLIRQKCPTIPIIALTVEETVSVLQRFMEAGANDYALKPFKAMDLISRIKVHLQYQEASSFYINKVKGIKQETLAIVLSCISRVGPTEQVEQIAKETNISTQTVYRYLKYMQEEGLIETRYSYGGKMGRPKASYHLRHKDSFVE